MQRTFTFPLVCLLCLSTVSVGQTVQKPNVNESKEFPGVYHSPSAESTPTVFRSVLQMEIQVKEADGASTIRYANGVVVGKDGLIACVLDEPNSKMTESSIESAAVLLLNGSAAQAQLLKLDAPHGLAVFRAPGLNLPVLELSDKSLVEKRRLSWHAVYRQGRKTYLYSRPLQVHKGKLTVSGVEDLCEIIDPGTSALSPDRSGSALLSLDGTLVAVMGHQPHWKVSPKSDYPRIKVAWAVPSHVIAKIIHDKASSE